MIGRNRASVAIVAGGLAAVTARRVVFLVASMHADQGRRATDRVLPTGTVIVAARDEEMALPDLLEALEGVEYTEAQLDVVVVDDGSRDGTRRVAADWAARGPGRSVIERDTCGGKAAALNDGLDVATGELVFVYDADEHPSPEAPARLARAFADPRVAAASGRRRVMNAEAGVWAGYAALEADVHQLITQRAKDRLGLGPAVLGSNCAYRRADLDAVRRFRPGALLEDSDLTVRLLRAGYRTRFVVDAVSDHRVPASLPGWWLRRARWSTGFTDVTRAHTRPWRSTGSPAIDLELVAFAGGYVDRLLFTAGALAWLRGRSSRSLRVALVAAVVAAGVEAALALRLADAGGARWRSLAALPLLAPVDIAASVSGMVRSLTGTRPWERRSDRHETGAAG